MQSQRSIGKSLKSTLTNYTQNLSQACGTAFHCLQIEKSKYVFWSGLDYTQRKSPI